MNLLLFIIIIISVVVVKIGSIAFELTGVSGTQAIFQSILKIKEFQYARLLRKIRTITELARK